MKTVVLEVKSLADSLVEVAKAVKSGRADREARISFSTPELLSAGVLRKSEDGRIEFPYEAIKVEFLLQAA